MPTKFYKYKRISSNQYQNSSSRKFKNIVSPAEYVDTVFNFAYDMAFTEKGEHRKVRSGGRVKRPPRVIFVNTFQGKIAEFGVYKYLKENGCEVEEPNTERMPLGEWDTVDIIVNGYKICVKSTVYYANSLLLETKDWDSEGRYIPNKERDGGEYDFFLLCRVKPSLLQLVDKKVEADNCSKEKLKQSIKDIKWEIDIPGFITREELKYLINNKYVIPQGSTFGNNTTMDAGNYYCQSGDLHYLKELIDVLLSGD